MSNLYAYSDENGFIHHNILCAGSVFYQGQWLKREPEFDLVFKTEKEIYSYWFVVLLTALTIGAFCSVFLVK